MGQNPETNRFEPLQVASEEEVKEFNTRMGNLKEQYNATLLRPDGTPVPKHWTTFKLGELVVIKNYTYRVAYVGETSLLFEPVKPVVVDVPTGN